MTIVFKISDNIKPKLIKYYQDLRKDTTPPYAVFQAIDADTTVTLYESGKVMLQGVAADIDANIWIDLERKINNRIIDINGKEKNKTNDKKNNDFNYNWCNTVGSDEVGTGDFFGPIVVTATYVDKSMQNFLLDLKVGDSKKITDDRILKIAPEIIKNIPYTTYIISNKEYNNKYNEDVNMNKIKAILHNKVLLSLLEKDYKPDKIVVDQFVSPKKYFEYLEGTPKIVKNIAFTTKAEDKCLSVACASIISRYIFLKEIEKIENEIGYVIEKGASSKVDELGIKIAKEKGLDYLENIAKKNFKNMEKIKEAI